MAVVTGVVGYMRDAFANLTRRQRDHSRMECAQHGERARHFANTHDQRRAACNQRDQQIGPDQQARRQRHDLRQQRMDQVPQAAHRGDEIAVRPLARADMQHAFQRDEHIGHPLAEIDPAAHHQRAGDRHQRQQGAAAGADVAKRRVPGLGRAGCQGFVHKPCRGIRRVPGRQWPGCDDPTKVGITAFANRGFWSRRGPCLGIASVQGGATLPPERPSKEFAR